MKVGTDGVLLGAWADVPPASAAVSRPPRVLDVGTGTGVIALMMAQRFPQARLTAIDVDAGAVTQARGNVAAAGWESRVSVLHQRVQELARCAELQEWYDAVVSNPPFFAGSLLAPGARRAVARHGVELTYGELMEAAWRLLTGEGELSVVVPFDYRRRMEDEATFRGFFPSRRCAVSTREGKPPRRFLLAFRKHPCDCELTDMTVGDHSYRQLTGDFYL